VATASGAAITVVCGARATGRYRLLRDWPGKRNADLHRHRDDARRRTNHGNSLQEGEVVQQGAPLIEIDPRPYLALREQNEGQLKRDQALLANAKVDLARYAFPWW